MRYIIWITSIKCTGWAQKMLPNLIVHYFFKCEYLIKKILRNMKFILDTNSLLFRHYFWTRFNNKWHVHHAPHLCITVAIVITWSHILSGILWIPWWMCQIAPKEIVCMGKIRGVCRPWISCATRDKSISREIPFEEFQRNIWTMWGCTMLLINDSIHVDPLLSPQSWDIFPDHHFHISFSVDCHWMPCLSLKK